MYYFAAYGSHGASSSCSQAGRLLPCAASGKKNFGASINICNCDPSVCHIIDRNQPWHVTQGDRTRRQCGLGWLCGVSRSRARGQQGPVPFATASKETCVCRKKSDFSNLLTCIVCKNRSRQNLFLHPRLLFIFSPPSLNLQWVTATARLIVLRV